MLIKHESFDVSQRRKSQRGLYEPSNKYPYLKFLLIPAVIGFMLLCILMNVDFSEKPLDMQGTNNHITIGMEMKNRNLEAKINKFGNSRPNTRRMASELLAGKFQKFQIDSIAIKNNIHKDNDMKRSPKIVQHKAGESQISENIKDITSSELVTLNYELNFTRKKDEYNDVQDHVTEKTSTDNRMDQIGNYELATRNENMDPKLHREVNVTKLNLFSGKNVSSDDLESHLSAELATRENNIDSNFSIISNKNDKDEISENLVRHSDLQAITSDELATLNDELHFTLNKEENNDVKGQYSEKAITNNDLQSIDNNELAIRNEYIVHKLYKGVDEIKISHDSEKIAAEDVVKTAISGELATLNDKLHLMLNKEPTNDGEVQSSEKASTNNDLEILDKNELAMRNENIFHKLYKRVDKIKISQDPEKISAEDDVKTFNLLLSDKLATLEKRNPALHKKNVNLHGYERISKDTKLKTVNKSAILPFPYEEIAKLATLNKRKQVLYDKNNVSNGLMVFLGSQNPSTDNDNDLEPIGNIELATRNENIFHKLHKGVDKIKISHDSKKVLAEDEIRTFNALFNDMLATPEKRNPDFHKKNFTVHGYESISKEINLKPVDKSSILPYTDVKNAKLATLNKTKLVLYDNSVSNGLMVFIGSKKASTDNGNDLKLIDNSDLATRNENIDSKLHKRENEVKLSLNPKKIGPENDWKSAKSLLFYKLATPPKRNPSFNKANLTLQGYERISKDTNLKIVNKSSILPTFYPEITGLATLNKTKEGLCDKNNVSNGYVVSKKPSTDNANDLMSIVNKELATRNENIDSNLQKGETEVKISLNPERICSQDVGKSAKSILFDKLATLNNSNSAFNKENLTLQGYKRISKDTDLKTVNKSSILPTAYKEITELATPNKTKRGLYVNNNVSNGYVVSKKPSTDNDNDLMHFVNKGLATQSKNIDSNLQKGENKVQISLNPERIGSQDVGKSVKSILFDKLATLDNSNSAFNKEHLTLQGYERISKDTDLKTVDNSSILPTFYPEISGLATLNQTKRGLCDKNNVSNGFMGFLGSKKPSTYNDNDLKSFVNKELATRNENIDSKFHEKENEVKISLNPEKTGSGDDKKSAKLLLSDKLATPTVRNQALNKGNVTLKDYERIPIDVKTVSKSSILPTPHKEILGLATLNKTNHNSYNRNSYGNGFMAFLARNSTTNYNLMTGKNQRMLATRDLQHNLRKKRSIDPISAQAIKTLTRANAMQCTEDVPNCKLSCFDGSVNYVDEDLEYLQTACIKKQLTLILENCSFDNGILKTSFFTGYFNLKALEIRNCNLQTIQAGAFKKTTVQNLLTLKLINNNITTLTGQTFEGVNTLTEFEFSQELLKFQGNEFLHPFAKTLQSAIVQQITLAGTVLNPKDLWTGVDYPSLILLYLSNNNLNGILSVETFRNLISLEELHLENCSLEFVDLAPFGVISQLKTLNLNFNHLKTLDLPLLEDFHKRNIEVWLQGNHWNCDCTNQDMIEFLQNVETATSIFVDDLLCLTPPELHEIPMMDVELYCEDELDPNTPTLATETTASTTKGTTVQITTPTTLSTTSLITTPSTISTTTIPSTDDNETLVDCSDHYDSYTFCFSFYLTTKLLEFNASIASPNSVIITSTTSLNYPIQFICFRNSSGPHSNAIQIAQTQWKFHNLESGASYLFCVLNNTSTIGTPYDCQALKLVIPAEGWLHITDMTWIAMVMAIACLTCYLLGMFLGYLLLRKKPKFQLDQIDYAEWEKKRSPLLLRMSSLSNNNGTTYLKPTTLAADASYDNPTILYNSFHKPPMETAPTPPPAIKNNCPLSSPGYSKKIPNQNINSEYNQPCKVPNNPNCNGVDGLNIYEVVNEPMRSVGRHQQLFTIRETEATINCHNAEQDEEVYHEIDHYEVVNH
ncbi:uncharacterized protein [Musca autumnalis]|uniref:uncharacterized protein n=1 Tax=Musca autumnalis TaxID=221902 RepID=UPI003CEB2619